ARRRRLLLAVPLAGQRQAILAHGRVGQRGIDGPRLLAAIQRERHLVTTAALPDPGRVGAVNLDGDARALICARTSEVDDLEHDSPDVAARIDRSVEKIGPGVTVVGPAAGALALLLAGLGNYAGLVARDLARERDVLGPTALRHDGTR